MTTYTTRPERPPAQDIADAKAEGLNPGSLRSRFMGQPWPRKGVSACGRQGCPVCDHGKAHTEAVVVVAGDTP